MTPEGVLTVFLESAGQVELGGSPAALMRLAEFLRTATRAGISIPVASTGPDLVPTISIRQTGTMVQIEHVSESLRIEGAQKTLDVLADNVTYVASAGADCPHIHTEYFEGHPYMHAQSIPLIISRSTDD